MAQDDHKGQPRPSRGKVPPPSAPDTREMDMPPPPEAPAEKLPGDGQAEAK